MGFKDVEWAYGLDLPMREKVVLAALCHRADDVTHQTFVGQETIAHMVGSSLDYVARALRSLERFGVITRTRRNGPGGFRTSDLITIGTSYPDESLEGSEPSRRTTYKADSLDLTRSQPEPTRLRAGAIDQPEDQPIGQPVSAQRALNAQSDAQAVDLAFDRAWAMWPKKVDKKRSRQAFTRAARKRGAGAIAADVARFGTAYARSVSEPRFVPSLSAWLNGERWSDDLPVPPLPRQLTRTEQNMTVVAQIAAREAEGRYAIASTPPSRCSTEGHTLLTDGTCIRCEYRT